MRYFIAIVGVFLSLKVFACPTNPKERKAVLNSMQDELRGKIDYSEAELAQFKSEFINHYVENVRPRLAHLVDFIHDDAIHCIDTNWDQKEELVFWTAGIAPDGWGQKEMLFVVAIGDGSPKIIAHHALDPKPMFTPQGYKEATFYSLPNRNRGNDFVRAVLTYPGFGVSSRPYVVVTLFYDKYEQAVKFRQQHLSFPITIPQ